MVFRKEFASFLSHRVRSIWSKHIGLFNPSLSNQVIRLLLLLVWIFCLYINVTALESILLIGGKLPIAGCTFTNFIFAAELRQKSG